MAAYIVTYHPISKTSQGRKAVAQYKYPPYIDGSCRREPDLESRYPSITSLCRGNRFVPKLQRGDTILYLSVQGRWEGLQPHWRLVALLRVLRTFPEHNAAATWYEAKGLAQPPNCMTRGSKPLSLSRTAGAPPDISRHHPNSKHLRLWDSGYKSRAKRTPKFVATKPLHLFLHNPPVLERSQWMDVFGKVLNTQSPQKVDISEVRKLFKLAVGRDARA